MDEPSGDNIQREIPFPQAAGGRIGAVGGKKTFTENKETVGTDCRNTKYKNRYKLIQ